MLASLEGVGIRGVRRWEAPARRVWKALLDRSRPDPARLRPDPSSDHTDAGVRATWIQAVGPDDLYMPWELTRGFGEQLRSNLAASRKELRSRLPVGVPGVLPTDILKRPKYPESPRYGPMEFIVAETGRRSLDPQVLTTTEHGTRSAAR